MPDHKQKWKQLFAGLCCITVILALGAAVYSFINPGGLFSWPTLMLILLVSVLFVLLIWRRAGWTARYRVLMSAVVVLALFLLSAAVVFLPGSLDGGIVSGWSATRYTCTADVQCRRFGCDCVNEEAFQTNVEEFVENNPQAGPNAIRDIEVLGCAPPIQCRCNEGKGLCETQ
jgi:hypothetical protein